MVAAACLLRDPLFCLIFPTTYTFLYFSLLFYTFPFFFCTFSYFSTNTVLYIVLPFPLLSFPCTFSLLFHLSYVTILLHSSLAPNFLLLFITCRYFYIILYTFLYFPILFLHVCTFVVFSPFLCSTILLHSCLPQLLRTAESKRHLFTSTPTPNCCQPIFYNAGISIIFHQDFYYCTPGFP